MTTAYTTLLKLALPVQGELTGTWGDEANNAITQPIADAIAGTTSYDVSGGNWTLTNLDGASSNTARNAILRLFGTAGAPINILAPNQSKTYVIINGANVAVTIKGVTGPTTGVTILSGKTSIVAWNGSDFVEVSPNTISGTLPVANGGTGATTLTGVLKGNGTSAFTAASSGTDFSAGTSALATGILKSTSSTGALTIAVAGDFPTLNQNTTGTASNLTSATTLPSGMTLVAPVLGTPSSGTLSSCTVDGTNGVGYINIPQNSQSAAYTLVAADAGKHIFHPSTDANARTFTIPANGSVAYPIGTAISFVNMTSQVVSIAIITDTMYLAGASTSTTGTRSLAIYGTATALKIASTIWIISGAGLT